MTKPFPSQSLFIHKNTLFSWMNDIRQRLRIDPVQNETDRAFWEYLCMYYEHRHSEFSALLCTHRLQLVVYCLVLGSVKGELKSHI